MKRDMHRVLLLGSGCKNTPRPGLNVLTPNPRAARTLGVPHQTLENFARRTLQNAGLAVAPCLIAHRTLHKAVKEVLETSDSSGTARSLAPALREILRARADHKVLECSSSLRIRQLALVTRTYRNLLRQASLVDPSEILQEAILHKPARSPLFIYGYPRFGADELAFIEAVAGHDSIVLLPWEDQSLLFKENTETATWLEHRGWEIEKVKADYSCVGQALAHSFLTDAAPLAGIQAYAFAHLEAEVREILSQVKFLLKNGALPNEVVLVARDEALYGPTVLAVAWEYGLPVRAFYQVPLKRTHLGTWVQLLLECMQDEFPFEPTFKFLSHPLSPELAVESGEQARQQHPEGLEAWQTLGVYLPLKERPKTDSRGSWIEWLRSVLNTFKVNQRVGPWAREVMAFWELYAGLHMLAPVDENIDLDTFTQEIQEILSLLTVPVHPGRGGVELRTSLSLFGTRYPHVFVLGMAEGMLPAAIQDDPVLDFAERKILKQIGIHLESAAEAARRETLSFYSLLQTVEQTITLSYPRIASGQVYGPSPFLARLTTVNSQFSFEIVASQEQFRRVYLLQGCDEQVLSAAHVAWEIERRREGPDPHDEYDGIIGISFDPSKKIFSASQLTILGQCPFRWFAEKVLALADPQEVDNEIDSRLRGSFYHKVLELAVEKSKGRPDLRQAVLDSLEDAFSQAEQDLQLLKVINWSRRRTEHLKILRRAVKGQAFLLEGSRMISTEAEFEGEWQGLKVRGYVDRIDRTEEGLVLIDYKTAGSKPPGVKDEQGKAKIDIQLPIYVQVAASVLYPSEPVQQAYYYSLTKAETLPKAQIDEEALAAFAGRVKAHLQSGSFPVDPDVEGKACTYCQCDLVCRRGSRLSRKGGVLE
jgi:ATP-dependent helicase/DNAse subunit B